MAYANSTQSLKYIKNFSLEPGDEFDVFGKLLDPSKLTNIDELLTIIHKNPKTHAHFLPFIDKIKKEPPTSKRVYQNGSAIQPSIFIVCLLKKTNSSHQLLMKSIFTETLLEGGS